MVISMGDLRLRVLSRELMRTMQLSTAMAALSMSSHQRVDRNALCR